MRVFDVVDGVRRQHAGRRVAVIGSCRVLDPFECLADKGRAVRVWANDHSATHTFGEARQIIKITLDEMDIPQPLRPLVFHSPETLPVRTAADKRILESVDVVIVEISERREFFHDPYYFQANLFYREFVSKYGAPLLPWYRAFSSGEPIGEELIETALEQFSALEVNEQRLVERVLRQTRMKLSDLDAALAMFNDIMFNREKRWILVSHFVVPGLGGTQMKDRTELIEVVRQVASHHGATLFDPSELLARHGKEVALASDGRDIYHYNRDFNITVADALLQAANLVTTPAAEKVGIVKAELSSVSVVQATDSVNEALLRLHRGRVETMGVDESGLHAHYKSLLDESCIAGPGVAAVANVVAYLLPRFDNYHVLRAGLGELAFVLAAMGLPAVGFDPNVRRFAAMLAGLQHVCGKDPEIGRRVAIGHTAVPSVAEHSRTLAIALHLIGYAPQQQDEMLVQLSSYAAVLVDPRTFLYLRNSEEEREAVLTAIQMHGFTELREFPRLSIVYCGRPGIL